MHVQAIRNIDTLKVIGTIGPRRGIGTYLGDNLNFMPDVGQQVAIQGEPRFMFGVDGKPTLSYPEPRYFRVIAVTPYCAYVKRWRDKDTVVPLPDWAERILR